MRVHSQGIGKVTAGKLVLVSGGKDGRAAPRGVDVHPEVELLADGRDFLKGVVAPQDGGAGGGVDVKGGEALVEGLLDEAAEFRGDYPAAGVDGDGPD